MTDIVASIDTWMTSNYGSYLHTFFGLCELARKTYNTSEQPVPVTITGTHKREQVSLDDKKQMITWVRVVNPEIQTNEIDGNDWAFGLDDANVQVVGLRMVVATKVELGESIIYQIAKGLPSLLSVSGYSIVSLDRSSIQIDHDHETIYRTELGDTVYEKHRFPWNIYVITFDVEFILNADCQLEPLPPEEWPVLTVSEFDVYAIILPDSPFVQIQFNFLTWTDPPVPVTLICQCALAQATNGPVENPWVDMGSAPGSALALTLDCSIQYVSNPGLVGFVDGAYCPMRIIFKDAYNRINVQYEVMFLISSV